MTNFYEEQGWGLIETTLLGMYAKCLKEMQKPEEYVNVLLKLLTKSASAENIRVRRRAGKDGNETAPTQPPVQSTVEHVDVHGYVAELVALSNEVSGEIITPMTNLWSDMAVDLYPRHFSDRDGFEVTVKLRYLLSDQLPIDRITVKVVSVATSQSRELVLESTAPVIMRTGIVRAVVSTAQTIPGSYIAEQLEISVGKLRFVHDFMAKTTPATPLGIINSNSAVAITAAKRNKLSFFPAPRALKGRLEMPKGINLERMRSVEVVIDVGDNNVFKGELRIRSATAGLRLITGSLEVMSATDAIIVDPATPGTLGLMEIPAGSEIRIRLPYNSDNELTELMIRIEVDYRTENGTFGFVDTLSVLVALPLAVNVQDIFKDNALYSKFQVSTAAAEVPLRVFSAKLEEGRGFAIEGGKGTVGSMTVFAKQPANFLYKIKKTSEGGLLESLQLVIEYTNMDEGLFAVRRGFW